MPGKEKGKSFMRNVSKTTKQILLGMIRMKELVDKGLSILSGSAATGEAGEVSAIATPLGEFQVQGIRDINR